MIWSKRFFTTFIAMFFTIILIVNIIFAFGLFNEMGIPITNTKPIGFYDDKYFGFTTLFDAFQDYFTESLIIDGFQQALSSLYKVITYVDINRLFEFLPTALNSTPLEQAPDFVQTLFGLVAFLFNALNNIPYMVFVVLYFFVFLLYVISIIIQFLLFILYLLSGQYYSTLPNTYSNNVILHITCLVKSPHCLGVWG